MNRALASLKTVAVTAPLFAASAALGAGFAIIEQSVTGLGNAYAGGAAVADDASTIYFNPAGMTRLDAMQVQGNFHVIMPSADYTDEGSYTMLGEARIPTTGEGDEGGVTGYVPNFYFVYPVNDRLVAGLGLHAPFGLTTDYKNDWVGRYVALESSVTTINFNPSIAYKINDQLSIGGGFSIQYVEATLSNAIDFGLVASGIAAGYNQAAGAEVIPLTDFYPGGFNRLTGQPNLSQDGFVEMKGDDIGFGFNIGVLWEPTQNTRFGVHYRSRFRDTLEGDADFLVPESIESYLVPNPADPQQMVPILSLSGAAFPDQPASADLTLPDTISVSGYHRFDMGLALMADISWTRWSEFDALVLDFSNPATPDTVVPENWDDIFRYSVGATYEVNERWTLRTGIAFDESPVPSDRYRSPRIPDEDRFWVALGASYNLNQNWSVDAGYVHIFVDDPVIDNDTHTTGQHLIGRIDASVNIFSIGASYTF